MEDLKKTVGTDLNDKEIVFSQSVKAGKRIYYLDVKKNRKDEMFLSITESKKVIMGEGENSQVSFEKHKIFLYKEDFEKFMTGLKQAIEYIQSHQDNPVKESESSNKEKAEEKRPEATENTNPLDGEIKIDIDF